MRDLTKEEKSAISRLESLSKVWPDSLWLFSASGTLCVMSKSENNNIVVMDEPGNRTGIDPDYVEATIDIENDGGDW